MTKYFSPFLFLILFLLFKKGFSQTTQTSVRYDIFNQIPALNIPRPSLGTYGLISGLTSNSATHQSSSNIISSSIIDNGIEERNRQIIEHDLVNSSLTGINGGQRERIENELMEDDFFRKSEEEITSAKSYSNAFNDLLHLDPNNFSLIRAQFDVENAQLDGTLSFDKFQHAIKIRAIHVRQILRKEGIKPNSSLALNYGIQLLYQRSNDYFDSINKKSVSIPPFTYQFEDYMGSENYENVLTEKLMRTGKGQCLSMPRLYLMIAEELGAKAWLSLSPQHSYVQFKDNKDRLINFETTNGNLASNTWLAQSGYVTAKALRNKTYLDTLSQRKLYSQCLADLLLGYLHKFHYDKFASEVSAKILELDPNNVQALIVDANVKRDLAIEEIRKVGKPNPGDLIKYPDAFQAYIVMKSALDKIDDLGYQDMPPDAYQQWLKSMELEKKKQANKVLSQQMQKEIQALKRSNVKFTGKSRN